MDNKLEEMIINQQRGNVRYIHPTEDEGEIAKMIAALANSEGGTILIGVCDDGSKIEVKGYTFGKISHERLSNRLNGFGAFTINEHVLNGLRVVQIDVQKISLGVYYNGVLYEFYTDYSNKVREMKRVKIFISYNHATSGIADIIEQNLRESYGLKIIISRDTQLEYRDDIDQFMQSIKENDVIVSIITKKYLESEACMFEVTELMRDVEYFKRLAFIIIGEDDLSYLDGESETTDLLPKVYGEQRYDNLDFWSNKKASYANRMKNLAESVPTAIEKLAATTYRVGRITDEIGNFLDLLNRLNGQSFINMEKEDFIGIKKMIESKLSD